MCPTINRYVDAEILIYVNDCERKLYNKSLARPNSQCIFFMVRIFPLMVVLLYKYIVLIFLTL